METYKKILKQIKKDALNLDTKLLFGFCIIFTIFGSLMSVVNFFSQEYIMSVITGVIAIFMVTILLIYRKTRKLIPVFGSMGVTIFLVMFYFLVGGGINGFTSIWLLLVPPIATSIFQLYYGGIFSIALGIVIMLYMWTPLHNLGYGYTDTYLLRFPVVYLADLCVSLITQYRLYISKQRLLEAYHRIEEADTAKGIFLSNMSHEARTPINSILGFNEMILKESQENSTTSYATNIQTAGRVLLSIVNDTLDYVNIQEGSLYLEKEPYSILSVLQDLIAYGTYYAEKKKIEFRFEMDETLPQELIGDSMRLTQVCNNLISNAVKYTNTGYVLLAFEWKQTEEKKGILSVRVKDTGIGIKEDEIGKIVDSFTRVDERKTKHVQGIGLGLALVTKLLDMMKSSLTIESVYGEGSVFSFELEQEAAGAGVVGKWQEKQKQEAIQEEALFWAPEAKILAVDDNTMNLELLRGLLQKVGIKPDFAANGEEALERVREQEYDLILMDHMMPVLDGMEAMAVITEENLCSGVPIVVLTANAVAGARELYLEAGFDDYLSKPVSGKQLYATVKKYLSPVLIGEQTKHQTEQVSSSDTGHTVSVSAPVQEENFLELLTLFDTKTGLSYCAENKEFYKEMLLTFLKNEKLGDIHAFYEIKDWNNYRILVHSLKSTSLAIGAVDLSEAARQLEVAAKEENHYYIDSHHADAMKQYRSALEQIAQVLVEKKEEHTQKTQKVSGHILVIDDDTMNLKMAERVLSAYFTVSLMDSAKEALEFLEHTIPDLILLDLHMPEIDGFEMMDLLRKKEQWKDIPVVFSTADNDRAVEVRGFKEGAQDFITKPFIAEIMVQRVRHILELSKLQKDLQTEVAKQTRWAEERRKKVERLSEQIMHTLAGTIDAKDKYTNGHSVRVAQYAFELAKKAGKEESEQERIYFMGMLHDIGKIGIPDYIITKQSGLTEEEYAMIRSHPKIGAEILQNISEIPKLDIGARWHHERFDGKGYPDALAGEQIPEEARLIAVADAYDAMASKRSYRDVLPQKVVYEEIQKGIGTQFDPYYAKLMLELIEEDKEYKMKEM